MKRSFFSSVRRVKLDRRAVLRGAGAVIALPLLDSMLDGRGVAWGATPPQPRLITVFTPNGLGNNGDEFTILQNMVATGPLSPLKADLTLVSGLYKQELDVGNNFTNDSHDRGHATFASGVPVDSAGAGGPTIDQIAAQQYGADTQFRSLPIAISTKNGAWLRTSSWSAKNTPVLPDRDPVTFFSRIFGTATPTPTPSLPPDYRRSILDFARADLTRLQARVGTNDRAKLEQHLSSIRDLEKEIGTGTTTTTSTCTTPQAPPSGTGATSNERLQLLMRLLVVALQCDLTRYGSVQICNRQDARQFSWIGVSGGGASGDMSYEEGHHGISHDYSTAGYEKMRKIAADHAAQCFFLLDLMKKATEGAGSLLDNSIVMYGSESSGGGNHQSYGMTTVLAGRAGGRLTPGREVKTKDVPYANMLCSVLNYAGVARTRFGTYGTGTVAGL
jgi:hypothetical protein